MAWDTRVQSSRHEIPQGTPQIHSLIACQPLWRILYRKSQKRVGSRLVCTTSRSHSQMQRSPVHLTQFKIMLGTHFNDTGMTISIYEEAHVCRCVVVEHVEVQGGILGFACIVEFKSWHILVLIWGGYGTVLHVGVIGCDSMKNRGRSWGWMHVSLPWNEVWDTRLS